MIKLRAGYKTDTTKGLSALTGFTTGIGLKVWGQEFSYAWLPYGDLGDTQYFSMLIRFGQAEEDRKNLLQRQAIKWHENKTKNYDKNTDPEYQQLMQLLQRRTGTQCLLAPVVGVGQ